MRRLLWILPLLLLLASCKNYRASRGPADWLYISPTGNNTTGNGTAAAPWATLTYACTQATSGDTIYVTAGNYTETARAALPVGVSILGDSTNIPVITYTYATAGGTNGCIYLNSGGSATVTNGNQSISYINLNGSSLTASRAIAVLHRNNVDLHHLTIEDFNDGGIRLYVSSSYPNLYSTGNKIRHCTINNSSSRVADNYPASIRVTGQDECDIVYNSLDMTERAAGLNGNTIEFQRNKRIRINHNTLYRLDHEIAAWNFFLECWDYSGDFEYTHNTHFGLAKVSLGGEYNKMDSGCTFGALVSDNIFLNPTVGYRTVSGENATLYAINMEGDGHVNVTIARNYIQNYGVGIELSTPASGEGHWAHYWDWNDIQVVYNVIDGVGYQDHAYAYGIWWVNETNAYPYYGVFNGVTIANNTVKAHDGATYDGYQGIGIYANDTINGLRISNNITSGFSSYGIYVSEHSTDTLVIGGLDATYNCMNGNGTNTVYLESAAGRITITDSDVTTGNITGDPLFKNAYSFRLQSTSPAINAGTNVSLTSDFAGHRVPQNDTVDIGAYEYGDYLFRTPSGKLLRNANGKLMITH